MKHVVILISALAASFLVRAQTVEGDTIFIKTASAYAIGLYQKKTGAQSHLYNGRNYRVPPIAGDHHPYFDSFDWVNGTVVYDGYQYTDVPLLYDIYQDKLISELPYNAKEYELIPEKVTAFTIGEHRFIRMQKQNVNGALPATGFYELIYEGNTQVIARHHKNLYEQVQTTQLTREYREKSRYYILVNKSYYAVNNKRGLLKLLHNQRQAIRKFMNDENLRFASDKSNTLARVAAYYDRLTR